jgi:hypothetical protein
MVSARARIWSLAPDKGKDGGGGGDIVANWQIGRILAKWLPYKAFSFCHFSGPLAEWTWFQPVRLRVAVRTALKRLLAAGGFVSHGA